MMVEVVVVGDDGGRRRRESPENFDRRRLKTHVIEGFNHM